MEKFLEIPIQQKLLLLAVLMLLLAGGVYFFGVSPIQDEIQSERSRYNKAAQEHKRLAQYKESETIKKLAEEEAAQLALIEENKKLLPTEDELPQFIQSIKSDADTVNLDIQRFEVGQRELQDYYTKIPIFVKVVGTYPQVIGFLKTLAAPSKRIVNVKDLRIKKVPLKMKQLEDLLGQQSDAMREIKGDDKQKREASSPEMRRLEKLKQYEALNSRSLVEGNFTVYTFSYTGTLAPQDKKKKAVKRKKTARRN